MQKHFFQFLFIICLITLIISCKNKTDNKQISNQEAKTPVEKREINEEYIVKLNFPKERKNELKGDFLNIFFEGKFEKDSITLFVNDTIYFQGKITTDDRLGAAKSLELGKLSEIKEINFRVNEGRDIILKNIDYNFLFVTYLKDSLVQVDFVNKFLGYY